MQLVIAAFESVPDPRAENVRHDLVEILIIAFVGVLCGAQGCSEMAEFGRAKLKFFKRFLKLRHGIPSHDTFSTVLRMLDPNALDAAFGKLTATLAAALAKGGVIAIDGKSLKGAYDKGGRSSPRMMVSAYAAGLRLTLATVAAKDRNEVFRWMGHASIFSRLARRNKCRSPGRYVGTRAYSSWIRRGVRPACVSLSRCPCT